MARRTDRTLAALAMGAVVAGLVTTVPGAAASAAGAAPAVVGHVLAPADPQVGGFDVAAPLSAAVVAARSRATVVATPRPAPRPRVPTTVRAQRDSVGEAALRACTAQTGMTRAECIADAKAGNAS
ncbi:hypothetical protein GCM10009836_20780 [Pseudonocardia ailaonensis]|uniref:Uncharacterized protein n=1 Tax=Pseudonocardia ailaonensis TaxID=367279 RepID=A0ABN2MWR5_9PSEU